MSWTQTTKPGRDGVNRIRNAASAVANNAGDTADAMTSSDGSLLRQTLMPKLELGEQPSQTARRSRHIVTQASDRDTVDDVGAPPLAVPWTNPPFWIMGMRDNGIDAMCAIRQPCCQSAGVGRVARCLRRVMQTQDRDVDAPARSGGRPGEPARVSVSVTLSSALLADLSWLSAAVEDDFAECPEDDLDVQPQRPVLDMKLS